MKPRTHSDCCNLLRLAVSAMGGLILEYKTGALKDERGRLIRYGKPGAADLIACIGGRFIAIEAKLDSDRQRPEQIVFQNAVEAAGGKYILARFDDAEDGVETLRRALSTAQCNACGEPLTAANTSLAFAHLCWECGDRLAKELAA